MNFIPRPLVQPGPSKKAYGRTLARMIATARRMEAKRAKEAATTPQENISPTTTL